MLVATLAGATRVASAEPRANTPVRGAVEIFFVVVAVESASRCLASTVAASPDFGAELSAGIRVGCTTAATALALATGRRVAASLTGGRANSTAFATLRR
jgi:hypothetical protein